MGWDTAEEAQRPTNIRWRIFALACGASFLLYLHRYSWNIISPKLQEEYRLSNTQAGFLISLFYYTYAAGQIPSGVVVDRVGPHRFLGIIIVAWSLAIAAIGQTSRLVLIGAARLLFGAAQAGCYPALAKATRSWFPASRRTIIQGWIATTCGRLGGATSPIVLGTVLMGWYGLSWREAIGLLGLIGAIYGLIFWWCFRSTPAEHPGTNEAERKWIGADAAETRTKLPLPAGRALKSRSLRFFMAQQFLDAGSDVAFVSLMGTYFLMARGFEISKTGWATSLPLLGGALGGIAGGWLNDALIARTGNRRWTRSGIGFVGKLIGCAMLALVVQQEGGMAAAWVLMLSKFFSDWSQPTVWGTCTDLGGRYSATVFSIINTAGTLGGVTMPLVFGAVLDACTTQSEVAGAIVATTDWGPLFALLAAMYLGSGFCWLMIDCTRSLDDESA